MARQMKDSGVEWIGEIPEEWNIVQSRRYVSVNHGADPKTQGEIPVYGSGSISFKTCGEYKEGPTVLLGRKGTLNAPQYITGKYWNVDTAFDVAVTDDIALRFYYYLATCFDYTYYSSQTAVPSMTQSNYLSMRLPIPFINVQNCIVKLLDAKCAEICKIIERTRATIEEYKKLKQAIITEAVTKGVRGPRPMKPSGVEWIGDIPEEWNVCSIKLGVSKVGSGKTPSGGAEVYLNEGVLFLRSQNIYDTGLQLDNATYISESTDEEMSSTRVYAGDVLLNITGGSIGRCCVYPADLPPANVNQHVCIIRTVNSIFTADYMHYFWISFAGQTSIQLYQTGGNREGMSADAIKNTLIPRMDISEQQEITIYLDTKCAEIDRIIEKKEQLIEELGSYKKSLIYEYVTGKKEVTA